MTIVGTHRGPVSGKTHIHLLRESAAVRSSRSAAPLAAAPGELAAYSAIHRPDLDTPAATGPHRESPSGGNAGTPS
jgi:hypothetical protein